MKKAVGLAAMCVRLFYFSQARGRMLKPDSGLAAMDRGGVSDPYVKVRIGSQRQRTTVRKKTISPVWDEAFDFAFTPALMDEEVVLEVLLNPNPAP